ncbi:striatin [Tritrichomonas foetus]|uniref:Striatin n=1 Tax=Tritrichomonas foetus TaxID=1144522 RepID=A0A1J4JCB8_9EUKA|nr:striatin [Tritrichomonas foetus]|eukprot:OHS96784.1 striatin [Tritrichomonas foetus]
MTSSTPSIQELLQLAKSHNEKKEAWDKERDVLQKELSVLLGKKAAWDLCRRDLEEQIYNLHSSLGISLNSNDTSKLSSPNTENSNQESDNTTSNAVDNFVKPTHSTEFRYKLKHNLTSHLDCIRAVAFYSGLPVIISASDDGTMHIINLEPKSTTKRKVRRPPQTICSLRGHSEPVLSMASFSSGGNNMIITGSVDGTIGVWQLPKTDITLYDINGIIIHNRTYLYTFHTDAVWSIDTLGMNAISASADKTLKYWDIFLGDAKDVKVESSPLLCKSCNDRSFVVSCENKTLYYYEDMIPHAHIDGIDCTALAVSQADHLILAGCSDGSIKVIQFPNMALVKEISAHEQSVSNLCITPCNNFFISCGNDGKVRGFSLENYEICKLGNEEKENHYTKYGEGALCCAGGGSSKLYFVTGGADGVLHVYLHD